MNQWFYFDVLNKNLIPIYNDGAVRIFSGDLEATSWIFFPPWALEINEIFAELATGATEHTKVLVKP